MPSPRRVTRRPKGSCHRRGGLSCKLHLVCDGKARPLSLVLSEGQRNDSLYLEPLLEGLKVVQPSGRVRSRPDGLALDKGYDFTTCRRLLRRRGIRHVIPERTSTQQNRTKKGRQGGRPCGYDGTLYRKRNVVEGCILRLKQFRRVATRYEKRAAMFEAFCLLAAILIWTR